MKTFRCNIAAFVIICSGTFSNSFAQNGDLNHFGRDLTPSAETYQMCHYGDKTSPDLFTGSMNYSVPVYTYHDADFTIPVSLDYHYDGFKPGLSSGSVGLGWSLNCGGFITRDVYGKPDEESYFSAAKSGTINAWVSKIKMTSDAGSQNVSFMDLGDHSTLFSSVAVINYNGTEYDCNADVFHLNSTCGCPSGDFTMLNDGRIRLLSPDTPFGEIEIKENGGIYYGLQFSVTASDGTVYTYGGSGAVDMCSLSDSNVAQTAAFKLRTITAPNGRTVTFNYSTRVQVNLTQNVYVTTSNSMVPIDMWSYTYPLETVDIDGQTIFKLNYAEKSIKEYDSAYLASIHNLYRAITNPEQRLSSVMVLNEDADTVQCVNLTQMYASSETVGFGKMFLTEVQSLRDGNHSFEYFGGINQQLPDYKCLKIDHWGFWNNTGLNMTAVSNFIPINNTSLAIISNKRKSIYNTLTGTGRNPSFIYAERGALTKITYPTGGYSSITYEQNDASYLFNRSFSGAGVDTRNNFGFQIGGIRVSKIVNSDGCRVYETKYLYNDSGSLYDMPRYGAACQYWSMDGGVGHSAYTYGNQCSRALVRGGYVGYSFVTVVKPDSTIVELRFCDREDEWDDSYETLWCNGNYCFAEETDIPFFLFSPPTEDYCSWRGIVLEETIYDKNGNEVSDMKYSYTDNAINNQTRVINVVNSIAQKLFNKTKHPSNKNHYDA